ncbi:hypothetical protein JTE90_013898 [Oedothorax gibbosus]|uniref:Spaetzle domain-containing protein n=1 Tax=Oedothorax gibbosus TaxID=931172 RepID=A0AAV6VIJ4_9ARAC|nr:hypothetical protein JTE90_013898 [Oedothorax gibbosus]
MNATFVLLLSSLLIGTSFLQEVSDNKPMSGDDQNKDLGRQAKSEQASFLSHHPLLTGAAHVRGGCSNPEVHRRGQQTDDDYEGEESEGWPYGRPAPPRRRQTQGPSYGEDECRVKFGLQYSSCFAKSKDFDDKFDELQHHVQSLPRGGGGGLSHSPCSTLQLLAKVKSSPIFDRCHGNQYVLRTPYHMYNVKGELRYIVQDPPHLEQCYLEAACSIPSEVCRTYGYPSGSRRGVGGLSGCESRHCHHTLLAWDPSAPDSGTFFDIFEYSCCCNCQHNIPSGISGGRGQGIGRLGVS